MSDWIAANAGYIIGQLLFAGALYGGIRSDMRNLFGQVAEAKEAARAAHRRIDDQLLKGSNHAG